MKRAVAILVLVAMLAGIFALPTSAQAPTRSYLVLVNGNGFSAKFTSDIAKAGGTIETALAQIGVAVVSSSNPNFLADAGKIAGVSAVASNAIVNWLPPQTNVPFEGDFGNPPTSGDDDTFFNLQWGHDAIDAPEAWTEGFRGAGVRVAVLDTGFDLDHPDLAPNINFALSQNFVDGETLSYAIDDPFSHGSHTAGTIAAADNGRGTIGVAPQAELVLLKVLSDSGSGSFDDIIEAVVYAADVDADVISMSIGATLPKNGWCDVDGCVGANEVAALLNAINRATTYAFQQGTTVIASAGNEATDYDHNGPVVHMPSDGPHVISIAATAPIGWATDPGNIFLDNPASYSNFGQSVIDFAAPGGDFVYPGNENCTIAGITRPCWVFDLVFSTGSNLNPAIAQYYWSAGTSMAAPHASGVAAIIIGKNGGSMHPAQVEAALLQSADDLGKPGNDDFYGNGRVNAYNAVR